MVSEVVMFTSAFENSLASLLGPTEWDLRLADGVLTAHRHPHRDLDVPPISACFPISLFFSHSLLL